MPSSAALALTLDLSFAQTSVPNGANIVVNTSGDLTITNDATINLLHDSGGNFTNGGDIFVTTGGDLTAGSLTVFLNNRDAGTITNGGLLVFDVGGALTTTGDASLVISGRNDGGGGRTFGSGANISLTAGSISIGGDLNVGTGLSTDGSAAQAISNIFATGALTTVGPLRLTSKTVLKVGALGSNGVLTIGNGSLTADSVLKLYAPGSNGTLNFVANVTISNGRRHSCRQHRDDPAEGGGQCPGNGGPDQVFTNNPNYSRFGGNNRLNGTFGGNGANNPLPLNQAPPFDGPPGG